MGRNSLKISRRSRSSRRHDCYLEKLKTIYLKEEHEEARILLDIQLKVAKWWRDACFPYFQTYSKKELPERVEKSTQTLDYFKSLQFPYDSGN